MNVASASKRTLTMTLRERFVAFVATPELISILYTVGMLAIFIELFHPGLVAPAVIGALCLVLAFLGLGSLPFNWAGLVLLGLAAAFVIAELHTGSSLLGVGAVLAFVIGALLLFSVDIFGRVVELFRQEWPRFVVMNSPLLEDGFSEIMEYALDT